MAIDTRSVGANSRVIRMLGEELPAAIRQRGERYLKAGAVSRLAIDDSGIRASVLGTRRYTVTIAYDLYEQGLVVLAACGCPYFQRAEVCKHIWATLLAAARSDHGHLPALDDYQWAALEADPDLPLRAPGANAAVGGLGGIELEIDVAGAGASPLPHRSNRASKSQRPRPSRHPGRNPTRRGRQAAPARRVPDWESAMRQVTTTTTGPHVIEPPMHWPIDRQILYVLDLEATLAATGLVVDVMVRQPKQDGAWSKPQPRRIARRQVPHLPDPADQQILTLLDGGRSEHRTTYWSDDAVPPRLHIEAPAQLAMAEALCRTGRCMVPSPVEPGELVPLAWQEGPPWRLWLVVEDKGRSGCVLRGELRQQAAETNPKTDATQELPEPTMPLARPRLLTAGGLLFTETTAAAFDPGGAFEWTRLLRQSGEVAVPARQVEAMVEHALTLPAMPPVDLPERLTVDRTIGEPRPHLRIHKPDHAGGRRISTLTATLLFHYGDQQLSFFDQQTGVYDRKRRRMLERDRAVEQQAWTRLRELGVRENSVASGAWSAPADPTQADLTIAARHVAPAVAALVSEGWTVEAEGKLHRPAAGINMDIRGSGIDWFELHGQATFDDQSASLPQLLQALKKGDRFVRLDDGSLGMLPEQWIDRYAPIAGLGRQSDNGHVRLAGTQIGLIDALLMQLPEVDFDRQVAAARKRLERFSRVRPRTAPRGFHGELRPYQRDGLGWLHFLRQIGFSGCLADDMGLGKTIQILALLESRRQKRRRDKAATPPSLVVVPRSLVHNWLDETRRFTPRLRVLDHTGPQRWTTDGHGHDAATSGETDPTTHFAAHDLVLTTYGTMRKDIALLKDVAFDYVVLDEAQAIKNASTASARAARLLQAQHRLALSGTPIENHIGELVSLFEFLNPGMLGDADAWAGRSGPAAGADAASHDQCQLLARAVRPFLLRRTKEQVASDLPEKIEQTLYCDLPARQRRHYDELRRYYGAQVMGKVDSRGLNRSKIDVLQALLRLRQAACHPGLIDKARAAEPAAKLDLLLPQLEEIAREGHKALVFSQFTSFLSIVRRQVEARGIDHAYIDGRTRKRQQQVQKFQNHPDCKLFLISLKAGGTGLNLTAADYVFLLDPWWNPAVEAQAIDRAHRIGQDKRVHAYRLIASDTVEEKVLELQQSKRDLADAIIHADADLIRKLSVDDLRYLFS